MKTVSKSSFTLFELLIVILIISIIYGIFIERLGSKDRAVKEKGLERVKEFLSSYDFNESAALKCLDECKRCFVYIDGKKVEEVPSFFKSEPKVYDYDIHGMLSLVHFLPVFKDQNPQDVCFEYDLFPNGSGSSYLVEYDKKYYIFYAYMHPVKVVSSLNEAQKFFDPSQWIPTDSSEYNF